MTKTDVRSTDTEEEKDEEKVAQFRNQKETMKATLTWKKLKKRRKNGTLRQSSSTRRPQWERQPQNFYGQTVIVCRVNPQKSITVSGDDEAAETTQRNSKTKD